MPFVNTGAGYGLVTKTLHWVICAIMSIQFGVGYLMTRVDDELYESNFECRYEHRIEQVLYVLMLAIPISGVLAAMADGKEVVFFGAIELPPLISEDSDLDDLTVGFHIAGHLAFFVAFALHVGLVIKHQLGNRDRLLNRML